MSLFEQILGAVASSQQQGSASELGSILGMAQQLSGNHGVDPAMMQMLMSAVGGHVQSSLQDQQASYGGDHVQNLVNQFSGTSASSQALSAVFGGGEQQVASAISQRTGMDPSLVMSLLPTLVPLVLGMLNQGAPVQGGGGDAMGAAMGALGTLAGGGGGGAASSNPVLNMFLDKNHDGNVDLGDAMGLAAQFLNK
jgi:Bacterial protein of unknown function (DUF937)